MLKRYVLLVLGVIALVVGVMITVVALTSGYVWFAYSPVAAGDDVQFEFVPDMSPIPGLVLLVVGTALTAGWTGWMLGRRTGNAAAPPPTA